MSKPTILKITKPDGTVHTAPLNGFNKSFYEAYNNRMKPGEKFKLEEITEDQAKGLDYIDPNYVPAGEAQTLLKAKDAEVDNLKRQLAELQAKFSHDPEAQKFAKNIGEGKDPLTSDKTSNEITGDKVFTVVETVAQIKDVTSLDELKKYEKDERQGVINAYEKKLAELQAGD